MTMLILVALFFSAMTRAESKYFSNAWLTQQVNVAFKKLKENISPAGAMPGAVIAARSTAHPDYYYHWVRDAAIAMDALASYYDMTSSSLARQEIRQKLSEYLDFSANIQTVSTRAGLGEPKFNVDGTVFTGPWGRPQNDGPALRAISMVHWANILIREGQEKFVREKMYDSQLPANLPIKKDLEYVSHHWRDASFDLWEEVEGTHFFNLMVSRRAMLEGAALAQQLGDAGAAEWYAEQAQAMSEAIQPFWDASRGYLVATLHRVGGLDTKYSNLDMAVILGLVLGDRQDGFLAWDDVRVQGTMEKLIQVFSTLYPVNQRDQLPGVAIGRYPEDRYSGTGFDGGNPWPLCTLAMAEALYRYAAALTAQGKTHQATEVKARANQLVDRVACHAEKDGSLSEQIDRNTGYMVSARDLTWNYAAILNVAKTFSNIHERVKKAMIRRKKRYVG
ncbi:MAG: hypothetical protein A3E85_01650 [Gammaproteobacteria bacterium RIFCSPHIGHO2_12_FULL_45_12]|nr:MAG: hypothetical protein A3E85_01650 [Gammaproteobacteria bacterium RIFCSPHIGHO2_12_FULL_45_12]